MIVLIQKLWPPGNRKTTVCIDSYEEGILQGRLYYPDGDVQNFSSLSRFLLMLEENLQLHDAPQADTIHRSFSTLLFSSNGAAPWQGSRRGALATFHLQILFRQHSSWQGMIHWQEQHRDESFRSVLELIVLMDSALREQTEQESA